MALNSIRKKMAGKVATRFRRAAVTATAVALVTAGGVTAFAATRPDAAPLVASSLLATSTIASLPATSPPATPKAATRPRAATHRAFTHRAFTRAITRAAATAPTPAAAQQAATSTTAAPALTFGTLDTLPLTAGAEAGAGLQNAMFEFHWADYEPEPGVFDPSYVAIMKSYLAAYQAAGLHVTLGLGLEDPPAWVFSLPDSSYVDQDGNVSSEADFVYSQAVRQAADDYLKQVAADFPLTSFWAIRLTSGGDPEMLYPGGGTYWAFSNSALTGAGLPPGMTPNPDPEFRPGNQGLSRDQVTAWISWYVGGLDNVTAWQMSTLGSLGFTGYYQTVTPGSGARPYYVTAAENSSLPAYGGTIAVGAVWDLYYAQLPDKANVIAYISTVADGSGGNDACQPGDNAVPLTSPSANSWSSTRWITRIASQNGLLVGGENPGYSTTLDPTAITAMMTAAISQAHSCGFTAFYWAHDIRLWGTPAPLSDYTSAISSG